MKTLNGAPQFEDSDEPRYGNINPLLRKWAESRRCVKCKFFIPKDVHNPNLCNETNICYGLNRRPETFSCAAFEADDSPRTQRKDGE